MKVHKATNGENRIVGFEVHPMSRAYDDKTSLGCSHTKEYAPQYLRIEENFIWTYCIRTEDSETSWANRMDHYYKIGSHEIHLLQLIISIGIVFAASCVVMKILSNLLRKDFKMIELAAIGRS